MFCNSLIKGQIYRLCYPFMKLEIKIIIMDIIRDYKVYFITADQFKFVISGDHKDTLFTRSTIFLNY